jgi:hypothetical protein
MPDHLKTLGLIPDQLLNNIKRGDTVLFLGADVPLNYADAPLSRPEMTASLARRYELPSGLSWPETAQAYLSKFRGDRHGLISFVADRCSGPRVRSGLLHKAIARVGFRAIVTAWYDELLEETLGRAGYRVSRIVRDSQLPYAYEGEREVIIIKLYGCISDPASLVLDVWDHEELMDELTHKLELVTAFCSLRPPLFAGFDLTDRMPMRLYVRASSNVVEHMKRAYAIWPRVLDPAQAVWQGRNVEFIRADPTVFLQLLAEQLQTVRLAGPGTVRVRRSPYKFLNYYEPKDADIFCGRDTESQIVARLVVSHRLLILFGASGAGKTSLLLAGVLPRLVSEDYRYVYVRALDDPLSAVRKAVAARAGRTDWETGIDLHTFFDDMLAPSDKLVVVLDQLEELFLRASTGKRIGFYREIAAAVDNPEREIRFVFSLREDYLANLDEARSYIPDIFVNSFRLAVMDRSNARVAITEPAARAGIAVEPALVDALVGEERRETGTRPAGDLIEADGRVSPAALQIVLDRLYRESLPPGFAIDDPPPPGLVLTQVTYRGIRHSLGEGEQIQELYGAKAILADYVTEGLTRLPGLRCEDDNALLGADRVIGDTILKAMVTSQATKTALTEDEILELLDEMGVVRRTDEIDRRLVVNTRLGLERVRLVRSFERDGVPYYELVHDHLAAEIAARIDREEMHAKMARELLRREMDNWRGARLLIRPEVLALIDEHRDALRRLSFAELELLLRSALSARYQAAYWFERAREAGVAVDEIVMGGLQNASFRIRAATVIALGQLGGKYSELIVEMLSDAYPQVRVAAISVLEMLRPDGEWRRELAYECYIPAGRFILGNDSGNSDEKPAHQVSLDALYVGKYLVTNAEYKRYMQDIGQDFEIPEGKSNHPVAEINFYSARDYARWAGMRLLSEAEWEKAAGWDEASASKRIYPWGDQFDGTRCNTAESGIGDTTPVERYSPEGDSPYGCTDMAGNVWEWTVSLYEDYPYRMDYGPGELASSTRRVLRGGSFLCDKESARCSHRSRYMPQMHFRNRGFRAGLSSPVPYPPLLP